MDSSTLVFQAAHHALRGASASLAVGSFVASAAANRRALVSLDLSRLRVAHPSRNAIAIAVFVGVYRLVHRYRYARTRRPQSSPEPVPIVHKTALVAAAVLSLSYLEPTTRARLLSLVATHAASTWFQKFIAAHPELAVLQPLELMVFLAASGWIFYSGFFHPESYAPSHFKVVKQYSLTPEDVATYLIDRYKQGLNPRTCEARHPGRACGEYAVRTFLPKAIAMALRIYTPVHVMTWLVSLRRKSTREKPLKTHIQKLAQRVRQSALYYSVYIVLGWTSPCYTNAIGDRSRGWRQLQFFLCGALPAVALLFEAPSRRHPIGVILSSYSFVSMATVLSQQKGFEWLQRGRGPARTMIEAMVAAMAVAYTFGGIIEGNALVRRVLLGPSKDKPPSDKQAKSTGSKPRP